MANAPTDDLLLWGAARGLYSDRSKQQGVIQAAERAEIYTYTTRKGFENIESPKDGLAI
ncbi:MAG: hypothetical protein PHG67_11800 [Bacteroidales bacterium]|nr:hypothetical protein [Bacteroidales bacterium]